MMPLNSDNVRRDAKLKRSSKCGAPHLMRESRPYGSVRGAPSNGCPYRDPESPSTMTRVTDVVRRPKMRCQLYVLALLLAFQGHAKAQTYAKEQTYLENGFSLLGKCQKRRRRFSITETSRDRLTRWRPNGPAKIYLRAYRKRRR
jgi:hypothetical protein